jgi:hypothetical protein
MLRHREEMETRLAKIRAKEKAQRERYLKGDQRYKKMKVDSIKTDPTDGDEEQFVLDDYDSDTEQSGSGSGETAGSGLSAATRELLEKLGMLARPREEEVEEEDEIKARTTSSFLSRIFLMNVDFLLLSNPFPNNTVHQRSSARQLPTSNRLGRSTPERFRCRRDQTSYPRI